VLGDLIDASHNRSINSHGHSPLAQGGEAWPIDDQSSSFYVTIEVDDRPGVLASVASVFGLHHVSIRSMEQTGLKDEARLIFITHRALESDVQSTLHDLRVLPAVRRVGNVMRVLDEDE
jgi:homoserine dehydrogenase